MFVDIWCGNGWSLSPIIFPLFHHSQTSLQHLYAKKTFVPLLSILFVTDVGTQFSILWHSLLGEKRHWQDESNIFESCVWLRPMTRTVSSHYEIRWREKLHLLNANRCLKLELNCHIKPAVKPFPLDLNVMLKKYIYRPTIEFLKSRHQGQHKTQNCLTIYIYIIVINYYYIYIFFNIIIIFIYPWFENIYLLEIIYVYIYFFTIH